MTYFFKLFIFICFFSCLCTLKASDHVIPSQRIIVERMADFLASIPNPDSGQLSVIEKLKKSEGECEGLSHLWMLSKRISDEPNPKNEFRDDNEFFKTAVNLLITRVPEIAEKPLLPKERNILRRFVGHVLYFQEAAKNFVNRNSIGFNKIGYNVDIEKAYEYLTGKKLIEMLSLNPFICNKDFYL